MREKVYTATNFAALFATVIVAAPAFAMDTEKLIGLSDDLEQHREAFIPATTELVENGTCTPSDFIENGGWVRSTSFGSKAVYFMYCGGSTVANRLYLDTATGKIFR